LYELTASADTRLLSLFPDTVKGFDTELAAVAGGQTQHALFRFPIEGLPAGTGVRSAVLTLRGIGSYRDEAPVAVEVFPVTSPWEEPQATWLARSTMEDWTTPGGDSGPAAASAVVTATEPGSVWEWDVTQLVQRWHAAESPNHGLVLRLPAGAEGIKSFASREHPEASMRPVLRVEMAAPPPP